MVTTTLDARQIIEAAREVARKSRDAMAPGLAAAIMPAGAENSPGGYPLFIRELQARMSLVMDCYLTGVEETLKRIMGDATPEPWCDEYDHESRIAELLKQFSEFLANNGLAQVVDAYFTQPAPGTQYDIKEIEEVKPCTS